MNHPNEQHRNSNSALGIIAVIISLVALLVSWGAYRSAPNTWSVAEVEAVVDQRLQSIADSVSTGALSAQEEASEVLEDASDAIDPNGNEN